MSHLLKKLLPVAAFLGVLYARTLSAVEVYNPLQNVTSIPDLVNNIITVILGVVGALALAMFIYGGVMWMTSAGNTQRIEKGKETLIWATIGLLIIFMSYAILRLIFQALSGSSE